MTNQPPNSPADLREISTRNQHARHIIAGFSLTLPALTDVWRFLDQAFTDTLALVAEIIRQRAEIAAIRLDRANLLAAIRVTLAAHRDGERDPLAYLRYELPDLPDTRGRR